MNNNKTKTHLNNKFPLNVALSEVIAAISAAQGKVIAVGGCVRDHQLGLPAKDIDLEIYQMPAAKLEQILDNLGNVIYVGKSFGVYKLQIKKNNQEFNFDISLPRTENKTSPGHKGFAVNADPFLSFAIAAKRRDFTINAMGINLQSGELLDPYGGKKDLAAKVIRHVSDKFAEDPLRVLRACRFAAQLDFTLAPVTIQKCKILTAELKTLPTERIYTEISKILLSLKPSIGLQALFNTGALEIFPQIKALIGCPQDPKWHPEGDVWIHTKMVLDSGAKIIRKQHLEHDDAMIIMLSCLCHDFGKPLTTSFMDGRFRSPAHDVAGEKPTVEFLDVIGAPQKYYKEIVSLVREHLRPFQLYNERDKVSVGAICRLAGRVCIEKLCLVAQADASGRGQEFVDFNDEIVWLRQKAENLNVQKKGPEPILLGRHLLKLGYSPGVVLGSVLKKAYEAQLDGEFANFTQGKKWLKKNKLIK